MAAHVETHLAKRFKGKLDELFSISRFFGGTDMTTEIKSADSALLFRALPLVPVLLMFWMRIQMRALKLKQNSCLMKRFANTLISNQLCF